MANLLRLVTYLSLCVSLHSLGALSGRDLDGNLATFEAYYDDVMNITWLADANNSATSGYATDGLMNWDDANTWAANLTLNGQSDWRLPTTLQPDSSCHFQGNDISSGFDCNGSEMGSLFYDTLGNISGLTGSSIATGPFNHVQIGSEVTYRYWSATESSNNTTRAWHFSFWDGRQGDTKKYRLRHVWAVHDGDIGNPVPLSSGIWLFLSGLVGLIGVKLRVKDA